MSNFPNPYTQICIHLSGNKLFDYRLKTKQSRPDYKKKYTNICLVTIYKNINIGIRCENFHGALCVAEKVSPREKNAEGKISSLAVSHTQMDGMMLTCCRGMRQTFCFDHAAAERLLPKYIFPWKKRRCWWNSAKRSSGLAIYPDLGKGADDKLACRTYFGQKSWAGGSSQF